MSHPLSSDFMPTPISERPSSATEIKVHPVSKPQSPAADSPQPKTEEREKREEGPQQLVEAVQNINDFMQAVRRELQFSIDEATGRTVIKVIDRENGEMIRQVPSEEVMALAQRIAEEGREGITDGTLIQALV
ncbi:Flagellar protein FlaG protein [Nitrosococcus oceani ATCC 19707]|uniref:Flagellar protein FlaG protein n=1 Tax=Nitrosococcus oceani (strain ATCC 19707 / BCRC 17464 / JCM 30415 / NCIMB 11848 / C-107) TaxID=323261 RepID=Q3J8M2_NITOC|nr:flagellar protein FlaG [Nitrosococcus oceani]ABA58824.1 Flagellar protein FlaG protein [Nitrosococcus oceani ATCC 19707]GEM19085.1 flagellar protein FlaG [Nitrosococcus oceani]